MRNRFNFNNIIFLIIFFVIIFVTITKISSTYKIHNIRECKVKKLVAQPIYSNSGTKVRYLVITDKETFIIESSMLNGKYNNSELFYSLYQDSTYNFKVEGQGKTAITDYRNILEVTK